MYILTSILTAVSSAGLFRNKDEIDSVFVWQRPIMSYCAFGTLPIGRRAIDDRMLLLHIKSLFLLCLSPALDLWLLDGMGSWGSSALNTFSYTINNVSCYYTKCLFSELFTANE